MNGGEKILSYYCYKIVIAMSTPVTAYYYAKTPLGDDMFVYCHKSDSSNLVKKVSDLKKLEGTWTVLTESNANWTPLNIEYRCSRYYEGDLYK